MSVRGSNARIAQLPELPCKCRDARAHLARGVRAQRHAARYVTTSSSSSIVRDACFLPGAPVAQVIRTPVHGRGGDFVPLQELIAMDALWELTEALADLVARPLTALERVARTAAETTRTDAAAVLIHAADEAMLAGCWGDVGFPPGARAHELRRLLDARWRTTAAVPLRRGAHEIGCLWVGCSGDALGADAQRLLRRLGAVTSLALPALLDAAPA